jgi:antitoxin component of MazEF toxin-antitoxin module
MTILARQIGGSVAVVIPRAVAREMGLTDGTPLNISTSGGAIVMRRPGRRERRPVKKIAEGIRPASYRRRREELGDDRPVGKERW